MGPVSSLLVRNAARWRDAGRLLWIGPTADGGWQALREAGVRPAVLCPSWASHGAHRAAGAESYFGFVPEPDPADDVIVSLPRGRERLDMLLDAVAARCAPGARVWLAGENRAGIRSGEQALGERFDEVSRADSARKCVLYRAVGPKGTPAFDPERYVAEWVAPCPARSLRIASLPGVFAHGRLDEGTALLLPVLKRALPRAGRVVDVGSGCGVIGACLAAGDSAREVTLVDDDAVAVHASERTVALNGLNARVAASDGLAALEGRFDAVVTNPPFHQGVRADVELTPRIFADLPRRLRPGGVLLMVVNRHLPYRRWLEAAFGDSTVLEDDGRYRVVRAVRAR